MIHEGRPIDIRIWRIDDGRTELVGKLELVASVHHLAYLTPAINAEKGKVNFEAASCRDGGRDERPGSTEFSTFSIPVPNRLGCSLGSRQTRIDGVKYLFHYWIMEDENARLAFSNSTSDRSLH